MGANEDTGMWGDLSSLKVPSTPSMVFGEQADALGRATNHVLVGNAEVSVKNKRIFCELWMIAPLVGDYRYLVASVHYPLEGYPAELATADKREVTTCSDEAELRRELMEALQSAKVRGVIATLLGESTRAQG